MGGESRRAGTVCDVCNAEQACEQEGGLAEVWKRGEVNGGDEVRDGALDAFRGGTKWGTKACAARDYVDVERSTGQVVKGFGVVDGKMFTRTRVVEGCRVWLRLWLW